MFHFADNIGKGYIFAKTWVFLNSEKKYFNEFFKVVILGKWQKNHIFFQFSGFLVNLIRYIKKKPASFRLPYYKATAHQSSGQPDNKWRRRDERH